jgi:hypothetical protein
MRRNCGAGGRNERGSDVGSNLIAAVHYIVGPSASKNSYILSSERGAAGVEVRITELLLIHIL